MRSLVRLQLDPIRKVERSHLLVLWSRLGPYDPAGLQRLLEEERSLFEYRAYIVPTEDFPLYRVAMERWPAGETQWARRIRAWLAANEKLRRWILDELSEDGPKLHRELDAAPRASDWRSTGWTNERNVNQMLEILCGKGEVLVHSRRGGQRAWALREDVLPREILERPKLPEDEARARSVERVLRALGVATARELAWALLPIDRPREVLAELERGGRVARVEVAGLPGERYVHTDDLERLDALASGSFEPRSTLLSPFDRLIHDRERTEQLFGFHFRMEIYVPKAKRRYGYYVMPFVHGQDLVGRVDPEVDRRSGTLTVNAVHWEPGAPAAARRALEQTLAELAAFVGADRVTVA